MLRVQVFLCNKTNKLSNEQASKKTNKQTNTIKTKIKHINTHTKPIITARKRKIINL